MHVLLPPGPGDGGGVGQVEHCELVEVGALAEPNVVAEQLGLKEEHVRWPWWWPRNGCRPLVLVAHRGAVFLVSQLGLGYELILADVYRSRACAVWRLVHERMEWEAVACLDAAEVERLTGVSHVLDSARSFASVMRTPCAGCCAASWWA